MAHECRGLDGFDGRWSSFSLVYDKEPGSPQPRGTIQVDAHTGQTITGRRLSGGSPVEFTEGKCRNRANRPTVISFKLEMDGALFFFSGTIQAPNTTSRFIEGAFFVISKESLAPTKDSSTTDESRDKTAPPRQPTPEPGDTGTWGGSQGF